MHRQVVAIVALGLAIAGCGEREYQEPLGAVVLTVDGPGDDTTVTDDAVEVTGRVQPATATVRVDGDAVSVSGGAFSTSVALEAGTNVIDVQAAAPKRPAAMTALRVTRQVQIPVPLVEGQTPDEAVDELAGLGFETDVRDVSGFFDALLEDDYGVCFTEPDAGTELDPGAEVVVAISPRCLD